MFYALCKHFMFQVKHKCKLREIAVSLFLRWERSIIIKHTSSIFKSLQSGREEQSRLLFSTASRRQINLVHLSAVVFSFCPPLLYILVNINSCMVGFIIWSSHSGICSKLGHVLLYLYLFFSVPNKTVAL